MNLRWPRPNMVGDRKVAAPLCGDRLATDSREQRFGVSVGDWHHWNLSNDGIVFERQTLRVLCRADAGGERITTVESVVDPPALHSLLGPICAFGKYIAGGVTVVTRIGIDDASHGAMLGGDLRLDAAPRASVTGDHDGPLYRHTHPVEAVIIGADALVHINQRRGHIAVDRVGRCRSVVASACYRMWGLHATGGSCSFALKVVGATSSNSRSLGVGKSTIEGLDLRVQPPALELRQNPLGVFFVIRRADMMGMRGQVAHVFAQVVGRGSARNFASQSRSAAEALAE